jgi:hypothetical protein
MKCARRASLRGIAASVKSRGSGLRLWTPRSMATGTPGTRVFASRAAAAAPARDIV